MCGGNRGGGVGWFERNGRSSTYIGSLIDDEMSHKRCSSSLLFENIAGNSLPKATRAAPVSVAKSTIRWGSVAPLIEGGVGGG